MNVDFGFIIVRHVNNETTNMYWQEAYTCIRKFYDDPIIIVDDNSNSQHLTVRTDLVNCQIIAAKFPAVGELLGYYYFYKLHPFHQACVIHDSIFFNTKIDMLNFGGSGSDVQFLWSFQHYFDEDAPTIELIRKFEDSTALTALYMNKGAWLGCFGIMSIISWELVDKINFRHNLFSVVLKHVSTRIQRCYMERIFAVMCYLNEPRGLGSKFGDIHQFCPWGKTFDDYNSGSLNHLPIIKVWTGR